jgi:4-hydroxyphenylpyruvate dioxygenase-like putative hemolysin
MDVWTGFYEKLFNFRQIRFFDIEGRASGLFSRALTSPDGKVWAVAGSMPSDNSSQATGCKQGSLLMGRRTGTEGRCVFISKHLL